ncbi:MAG: hypothetical protein ABEJ22_07275 [Haloferacaceae archaeon]
MEDLNGRVTETRGQLLLIAGLSLAVVLVVLALLLNSAIYTQNLATRGGDLTDENDVSGVRESVEHGLREAIQHANRNHDTYADQENAIEDSVSSLSDAIEAYGADDGRIVSVTYQSAVDGTRIFQSSDGKFTDSSALGNWDPATGVDGVRAFRMDVSRSDLASLGADPPPDTLPLGAAFHVDFAATDTYRMYVYRNGAGQTIVAVYENSDLRGYCRDGSGSRTVIDVTDGSVGGQHCEPLDFFESLGTPFDVQFRSGALAEGTYELTVPVQQASLGSSPPHSEQVIYSTTATVSYHTPDISYETTVTVAPGGPSA